MKEGGRERVRDCAGELRSEAENRERFEIPRAQTHVSVQSIASWHMWS